MNADDSDAAARVFYQSLAQAELFLLLAGEMSGTNLAPQVFDLPSGRLVLAFDSMDRLATWAQDAGLGPQPYAALPGRVIAQQLAAVGDLGLGLNFGAGTASEMVLPAQAMGWLAQMLDVAPVPDMGHIAQVLPLGDVPDAVVQAITRGLAGAGGMAGRAVLARVQYSRGATAHVLAILGADMRAHAPLARAVAEALAFSGLDGATLDVIFPPDHAPSTRHFLALGRDIPLPLPPAPEMPQPQPPRAPGMDPAAPPKLR